MPPPKPTWNCCAACPARYQRLAAELGKRIIGQDEIIRDLFVALAVQGHVLMIGVPGLAKTLLVRSLAEILELQFQRIQFTPDLMPSDITGTEIIEEAADGKRRVPLRARADLRQPAARRRDQPHAAQDPGRPARSHAGTVRHRRRAHLRAAVTLFCVGHAEPHRAGRAPIPLPEAQLDRFMFNLRVDYPSHAEEVRILLETTSDNIAADGERSGPARR